MLGKSAFPFATYASFTFEFLFSSFWVIPSSRLPYTIQDICSKKPCKQGQGVFHVILFQNHICVILWGMMTPPPVSNSCHKSMASKHRNFWVITFCMWNISTSCLFFFLEECTNLCDPGHTRIYRMYVYALQGTNKKHLKVSIQSWSKWLRSTWGDIHDQWVESARHSLEDSRLPETLIPPGKMKLVSVVISCTATYVLQNILAPCIPWDPAVLFTLLPCEPLIEILHYRVEERNPSVYLSFIFSIISP